jgi:hypothetical protein
MMGFTFLASGVRFDITNEEGHLLHMGTGVCVHLDPIATLVLRVALETETKAQALAELSTRIDASETQLEEAIETTLERLFADRFLSATAPSQARHTPVEPVLSPLFDAVTPESVLLRTKQERIDWEFFLTGRRVNSPLPCVSWERRAYAYWRTGTILLFMGATHLVAFFCAIFRGQKLSEKVRQRAWRTLEHRLSLLGPHRLKGEQEEMVRVARRELVLCQMLVRLLAPTGVCLARSIAFCAYLRALGLAATVVIGRARFDLSSQYPFHAWTELEGQVINDHAELQSGYTIMTHIPTHN